MTQDNGMDHSPSWQQLHDEVERLRPLVDLYAASLKQAEDERDALAATMEEVRAARELRSGDTLGNICAVLEESPTTPLARRDAEVIGSLSFPTMLRKMWSGGEVQQWLKEQAAEKRRQAEEES